MSFLDSILNKLKGVTSSAGAAISNAGNSINKNITQASNAGGNFFTRTLPQAVNPVLDSTFNTKNPKSLSSIMGDTLSSVGKFGTSIPQAAGRAGAGATMAVAQQFNKNVPNQITPSDTLSKVLLGSEPVQSLTYQPKTRLSRKVADMFPVPDQYKAPLAVGLSTVGAAMDLNPVAGMEKKTGIKTVEELGPAVAKKFGKTAGEELVMPVTKFLENFSLSKKVGSELSKGIEGLGFTAKKVGQDVSVVFHDTFDPALKAVYKSKPLEQVASSTPLNVKKLEDIYSKTDTVGLTQSLDNLLNQVKMKTADNIVHPLENILPAKGTFTKLNPANLEQGYLNKASGLPVEGLPAQTGQNTSLLGHMYNQALVESKNILNKMGTAGKTIGDRIVAMYDGAERAAGQKVADLQQITNKIPNPQFEEIIRTLRGEQTSIPQNSPIITGIRSILDSVQADAKAAGLDTGYIQNYIPQMIDEAKLAANKDLTINHLLTTGQFKTYEQAAGFVSDVLKGDTPIEAYSKFVKPLPKKMSNLEFSRVLDLPAEVLRNDKQVLSDYIEQAYQRIHQTLQFGKNNEIGTNLLNQLEKQGYDRKVAQNILDRNLGLLRENVNAAKISSLAREAQAVVKLPLAAITNAGQSTNTATKFGTRKTLSTIFNYFTGGKSAQEDFALRTGAVLDSVMNDIKEQWTGKGIVSKLASPGFAPIEKFNRVIAANVGRSFAYDRFQALLKNPLDTIAARDLEKMGINVQQALQAGKLAEEDLLKAGQKAVNITQFKTRPIDLPPTWSSSTGKVITQFKTFAFKHGQFVRDQVIKPALQGDFKPLSRYILVGTLVGEGVNDIKSTLQGKQRTTNPAQRVVENISTVGGIGLLKDAIDAIQYGDKGIISFIAGPTVSDALNTVTNTVSAVKGNAKPLAKQMVQSIPFVGTPFVNTNKQLFTSQPQPTKLDTILKPNDAGGTGADTLVQNTGNTPLDKASIDAQIKALEDEQKKIIADTGTIIPFTNFKLGGTADNTRNAQLQQIQDSIKTLKEKSTYIGNTDLERQKADFLKSDKSIMEVGDNVFRKSPTGGVITMTKDDYQSQLNAAKLTSYKKNENVDAWLKLADQQFLILNNRLNDPRTDELDKTSIQNQIDTLVSDYQKFKSYGGFTKPKKGKSTSALTAAFAKGRTRRSLKSLAQNLPKSKTSSSLSSILKSKRLKIADKPKI